MTCGSWRSVGRGGVEPPTFHFSGGRSYQLSYLPERVETIPEGEAEVRTLGTGCFGGLRASHLS